MIVQKIMALMNSLIRVCATALVLIAATNTANAHAVDTGQKHGQKRIAFSFDDAPRPDGAYYSGPARTDALIKALRDGGVEQAVFFATTGHIKSARDRARLLAYASAGHVIANHSHAHAWLHKTDAARYLADIDRAEALLSGLPNRRPWFRYPFLDEGRDWDKQRAVRDGLNARGLLHGYVTIDNYDWYIDDLARKAKQAGSCLSDTALRDFYVTALIEASDFYDTLARAHLGRSPAHVILLHENDLAAKYSDDLARALRRAGWTVITPDEAYGDPLARQVPETLFNGAGRVAAIARTNGAAFETLFHWTSNEQEIDKRFQSVLSAPCQH